MKNRKIVQALSKLNKQELLRFQVFLESPYFNVNKDVLALYNHIHFGLSKNRLDKMPEDMDTWQLLFPAKPFDSRRFNLLFFYLSNQFDRFISQLEYEKLSFFKEKLKCEILGNVGIKDGQKDRINKNMKILETKNDYSPDILINQYFIKNTGEKRKLASEALPYLKLFYILEKMYAYVTLLSWKKMYQLDVEIHFMEYVDKLLSNTMYAEYPAVKIYNKITDALLDENETSHYFALRELMNEFIDRLSDKMKREVYTTAVSYCIAKVNLNKTEFYREAYEVYKEMVEQNIILENNEITASDFRNIVFAALRVREFAWTEKFIEEYKKFIDLKFRDNAVNFSLARLELNRENYNMVLEYLQRINYEDVWYQLGSRTMQMAAYYALSEFDVLESFLGAFKMYINREKSLTKDRKISYINMIKFTKKMLFILPSDKSKIQKLRTEIENTKIVASKPWLLERVDELAKSKS